MTGDPGRVEKATRAQLRALHISVQDNALGATAVVLSRLLDEGPTPRDAAALTAQLRGAIGDLEKQAAAKPTQKSSLDELRARRERRLGG